MIAAFERTLEQKGLLADGASKARCVELLERLTNIAEEMARGGALTYPPGELSQVLDELSTLRASVDALWNGAGGHGWILDHAFDSAVANAIAGDPCAESRDARHQLDAMLAAAPIGVAFFDRELRFQRLNAAIAELAGLPIDAHLGRTLAEMRPEHAPILQPLLEELLEDGAPIRDLELETAAGTWTASYHPVRGSSGKIIGVGELLLEVGSARQTERELDGLRTQLHAERQRAAAAFDQLSSAVMIAEAPSGKVVFGNARSLELMPATDARTGARAADRVPLARALAGERVRAQALSLRSESGARLELEASASAVRDETGRIVGAVAVLEDVTERRRLQEDRRLSSDASVLLSRELDLPNLLQAVARLVAHHRADYCVIDLFDGGVLRRVEAAASTADHELMLLQLLALAPRAELAGPLRAIAGGGRAQIVTDLRAMWLEAAGEDAAQRVLIEQLAPQSALIAPLRIENRTIGLIKLISRQRSSYDARDLELIEELARNATVAVDRARQASAAAVAIRSRDELLAALSIEVRRSLGAVMLTAAALSRGDGQDDRSEKARRRGTLLKRTAERISAVIDDALDLSGIDSGRLTIDKKPIDVLPLLTEAAETLASSAEARGTTVELAETPPLPLVEADADRLFQVLWNLGRSALKLTAEDGAVRMAAEVRGPDLIITVADQGPAIPDAELAHILEHPLDAKQIGYRGALLSIALAKRIVEAHGGRMWVTTGDGAGTIFSLSLPIAAQD